jgi:hypothetical protein
MVRDGGRGNNALLNVIVGNLKVKTDRKIFGFSALPGVVPAFSASSSGRDHNSALSFPILSPKRFINLYLNANVMFNWSSGIWFLKMNRFVFAPHLFIGRIKIDMFSR